jgi:hypothetical protein
MFIFNSRFSNARSSTSPYENFPHLDITKAIGAYLNEQSWFFDIASKLMRFQLF